MIEKPRACWRGALLFNLYALNTADLLLLYD